MSYYQNSVNQNFARYRGTGTAQQVGSWTHKAVADDMRNNFIPNQMSNLPYISRIEIERSYLLGQKKSTNVSGCSRPDIIIWNNVNNNIHVGDIKTGRAKYGTTQQNNNEVNIGGGGNYTFTHQQIKPE